MPKPQRISTRAEKITATLPLMNGNHHADLKEAPTTNLAPDLDPRDIDRERDVVTLREAAQYLNCHASTLYRMVNEGDIPGFRLGGSWRFRRSELDEWIASQTVRPVQEGKEPRKAGPKRGRGRPKR